MERGIFDFAKVQTDKKITKDDIYNNQVNQLALFERYFGQQINLKKSYCNRLRSDTGPGCKFRYKNGILYFTDYAQSKSYDVIQWVIEDLNLTYPEALRRIYNDFKLGNSASNPKMEVAYEIPEDTVMEIQIQPKAYSKEFIDYFNQYHILPKSCEKENVYCVKELFYNKEKYYLADNELCIAYYYPDIDRIKILRPNQPKISKWRTNVPNTYIDGIDDLTTEVDYVLFVKSKKDKILLVQLGFKNVLAMQMEGTFVITEEVEEKVKGFRKFIWMDNDKTGKMVSKYYEEKGYSAILFEDYYYSDFNVKDPTDYVKEFQETKTIINFLNSKLFPHEKSG